MIISLNNNISFCTIRHKNTSFNLQSESFGLWYHSRDEAPHTVSQGEYCRSEGGKKKKKHLQNPAGSSAGFWMLQDWGWSSFFFPFPSWMRNEGAAGLTAQRYAGLEEVCSRKDCSFMEATWWKASAASLWDVSLNVAELLSRCYIESLGSWCLQTTSVLRSGVRTSSVRRQSSGCDASSRTDSWR